MATGGGTESACTELHLSPFELALDVGARKEEVAERFSHLLVEEPRGDSRGGSGYVCRATTRDGIVVAVKRIRPTACPPNQSPEVWRAAQERVFREEYRTQLTVMGCPGFPQLYGYGQTPDGPAIVMEWVDGLTLKKARQYLPADGTGLVPTVVCDLGLSVAGVLREARRRSPGLIHRDLSPRNIMLRTDRRPLAQQVGDGTFDVVLIDLGSSVAMGPADGNLTMQSHLWRNGTPEYAPPEMLTIDIPAVDRLRRSDKVDVYALCSVLYELYCGQTPYRLSDSDDASPYRAKMSRQAYPLPCRRDADLGLCESIMRGIVPLQEERPTLDELTDMLLAWRQGGSRPSAGTATCNQTSAMSVISAAAPADAPDGGSSHGHRSLTRRAFGVAAGILGAGALAGLAYALLWRPSNRDSGSASDTGTQGSAADNTEGSADSQGSASTATQTADISYAWPAQDASTGLWGMVAQDGSWAVQPTLATQPGTWSSFGTPAQDSQSGLWGYLAADGSWAIKPAFSAAGAFSSNGYAAAQANKGLWGILASDGSWAVEPGYASLGQVTNGAVPAEDASAKGNWGLADLSGAWLIEPKYKAVGACGSDGLVAASVANSTWGYLRSSNGSWAIEATLAEARAFSEGLAACRRNVEDTTWSYIDESAQVAYGGFTDALPFSEGMAPAKDAGTGLWGLIDQTGAWAAAPAFQQLYGLHGGVAAAQDAGTGLWGLVDKSASWVVQPTFSAAADG